MRTRFGTKEKRSALDGMPILRPGSYLYWRGESYQILDYDRHKNSLTLPVSQVNSGKEVEISIVEIFKAGDKGFTTLFAPTLPQLEKEIISSQPELNSKVSPVGLPERLLKKADEIINTVQTTEKELELAKNRMYVQRTGSEFSELEILQTICRSSDIGVSTFYKYRKLYTKYSGNRNEIANSFKRRNCARTEKIQYHLSDTLIMRFYARNDKSSRHMLLRPATIYKLGQSLLKRTEGLWIDPDKIKLIQHPNLIEELFDTKIPMKSILDNPEKAALLKPVDLPSKGWFYEYLNWFKAQPDTGKQLIVSRHGQEFWDKNFLVYDTFIHQASYPLHYVFVDHWLTDAFIVDEETRSKVTRLWLTMFIDAYTRCILGFTLNYEDPCIESIQNGLFHSIWPKSSHEKYNLNKEYIPYGIPMFLVMDNAWAHHSISLENLSRTISQGGKYNNITLMFRPPYKGRYGAIIERCFLNLSELFKQTLPGAIMSSHPKDIQNATKKACLLYSDIDKIIHKYVLEYQHTPHHELNNLTPHQKWLEATQFTCLAVPPLTDKIERLFWRGLPDTRIISQKGVSVFGMHYSSNFINQLDRIGRDNQHVQYSITYQPQDISRIALFKDGTWIGDLKAKELRQPDGSYRSLSLWEKELAKDLANTNEKDSQDSLEFVNEIGNITETRQAEKTKSRRAKVRSNKSLNKQALSQQTIQKMDEVVKAAQVAPVTAIPDYGKNLRNFGPK